MPRQARDCDLPRQARGMDIYIHNKRLEGWTVSSRTGSSAIDGSSCKKTDFFYSFLYVLSRACLGKMSILYINGYKGPFSHLLLKVVVAPRVRQPAPGEELLFKLVRARFETTHGAGSPRLPAQTELSCVQIFRSMCLSRACLGK